MFKNETYDNVFQEFMESPLMEHITKSQVENVTLRAENAFLKAFIFDHICRCYYIDSSLEDLMIHGRNPNPHVHVMYGHVFNILKNCESIEEARDYLEADLERCMEFIAHEIKGD